MKRRLALLLPAVLLLAGWAEPQKGSPSASL